MAGLIVHLIVAEEVLSRIPIGTIQNKGLFYQGAIVPDAIHARSGYIREDKKRSHLREGILDKDFHNPENLALFYQRVSEFIHHVQDNDDSLLDLYRGYVVHLLTDELYVLTLRHKFCLEMELMGIHQEDKAFFDSIIFDMYQNDYLLVHDDRLKGIRIELEGAPSYDIMGFINANELSLSKNWLLHRYFEEQHDESSPQYISLESTLEFIQMAADDIVKRLKGEGCLPSML